MDITDEVVKEIGPKLLNNPIFLGMLSDKLAEVMSASAIMASKPSELVRDVRYKRGNVHFVSLNGIHELIDTVDIQDLANFMVELLGTQPLVGDYYPVKVFIQHLGPLFDLNNQSAWNRSKHSKALIAGVLNRMDLMDPENRTDEYGFVIYRVRQKRLNQYRNQPVTIEIPRLKLFQTLIRDHFEELQNNAIGYKASLTDDRVKEGCGWTHAIRLVEDNPDIGNYTNFLDFYCLLSPEQLNTIRSRLVKEQ